MVHTTTPALSVRDVIENIPKSLQDNRVYRGLVLGNDLKVLLISDPATEKAAAALDVHIGQICRSSSLSFVIYSLTDTCLYL